MKYARGCGTRAGYGYSPASSVSGGELVRVRACRGTRDPSKGMEDARRPFEAPFPSSITFPPTSSSSTVMSRGNGEPSAAAVAAAAAAGGGRGMFGGERRKGTGRSRSHGVVSRGGKLSERGGQSVDEETSLKKLRAAVERDGAVFNRGPRVEHGIKGLVICSVEISTMLIPWRR